MECVKIAQSAWRGLPPREQQLLLEIGTIHRLPGSGEGGFMECDAECIQVIGDWASRKPLPLLKCDLYVPAALVPLNPGDRVVARAVLSPPLNAFDPGFRYHKGEILKIEHRAERSRLHTSRHWTIGRMVRALGRSVPDGKPYDGYIQSMLTGDKRYLDREGKRRFRDAGVMHFFAISGFHLSVVALICFSLLQLAGLSKQASSVWMLTFCGIYVWLTGAPVSAQRAFLMMLIFFGARWVRRKPDALSATMVAAWVILLLDPPQLFTPGFQLSFAVVIGLLTQALPLHNWLNSSGGQFSELPGKTSTRLEVLVGNVLRFYLAALAVSWTAFWLSAPIVSTYFARVPFVGIVLNTFLVPLFTLTMVAGFLSALSGVVGIYALSDFINHAVWVLLGVVDWSIGLTEGIPLGWNVRANPIVATAAMGGMLWVGCFLDLRRRSNRLWFAVIPLISLSSLIFSTWL